VFLLLIGCTLLLLNMRYLSLYSTIPETTSARNPKPVLSDHPFQFAACLILKDGNQILPEWLAYHYTVLPLQHLIVAVDPFSVTSPEPILEKFREIGMNITIWTDKDYFPKNVTYWEAPTGPNGKFDSHIRRQKTFYSQCLEKFRADNKSGTGNHSWAAIVDTDEFIIVNYFNTNEGVPNKDASENNTKTIECYNTYLDRLEQNIEPRARLPLYETKRSHISLQERQRKMLCGTFRA
jgi:hypothetical protein